MRVTKIDFFCFSSLDSSHHSESHSHATYEINLVLDGNLDVTIEENTFNLFPGDILLWKANMVHHNKVGGEGHAEFASVHFLLSEDIPEGVLPVHYHFDSEGMLLFNMFISEAKNYGTGEDSPAISLLETIIKISLRGSDAPHFFNDNSAKIYGKIFRLMATYPSQTLPKIPEIAQICGVSERTVKNAFKKQTGKSIKKYYNDLRIQSAKKLLLQGKSTGECAKWLSFSSVSYFSQFFKKNTGMSIREFLQEYKTK